MSNLASTKTISKKAAATPAARQQSDIGRAARLIMRFTSGQRSNLLLAGLMLVLEALTAVLIPLVIAYLIDGYLTPRIQQLGGNTAATPLSPLMWLGMPPIIDNDIDTIAIVTIGIVLLTMINSATDSLAEIFLAKGGRLLGLNLRVALYAHLQRLSLAFYGQQRTGDLLTRVTGDVTALEDFVTSSLSDIVGSILLIAFILISIVLNAWQVALMALVIIPIMALVSNYFSQRIKAASKKQRSREGDLAASAQEMLTSIRVIQTYGRAGNQEERFASQSRKTMESALEAAGLQARFSWVVSVLESVATAAVIWVGVGLLFQSPLVFGIGLLTAFIKYIQDMFKPTKKIIKEWNTFGKIYASVERIGEIFERQPAVQDAPDAIEAPPLKGEIAYEHVSFAYQVDGAEQDQMRLALRDLSFSIAPGQVVALVGGSGAGKSTIVQLLPRLYDPHVGKIVIDGHDIREFTLDSLRSRMSMVLQEAILFTGTVADNIAYGVQKASREEIIAAAMQANAHEFIEKLPDGYDTVLGERAGNLSGGQRQRIAIARAFIRNTSILILDEPTTGLDAESTDLVLLALRSLMKGKATVIISHDLNLIRHADKIVVITQGEVAQQGTHKELLKQGGLYADLYHKQFSAAVEEGRNELAPVAAAVREEEEEPVTPKKFQTMIGQALPKPVTHKAFETMIMQVVQIPADRETRGQGDKEIGRQGDKEVGKAVVVAPTPLVEAKQTERPESKQKLAEQAVNQPQEPRQPATFETTLMPTIAAPAPKPERANTRDTIQISAAELLAATARPSAADTRFNALHSPALQHELPGLLTAFDDAAMREYLQSALFGKDNRQYQIERCAPGKAIYQGETCTLRYQLDIKEKSTKQTFQAVVAGRVFGDQLACAVYMRDKLAPLATLMRGRAELAPFAAPVAMIEPLNMVVHVFPIDGELPTLIGATDQQRMLDIFAETLPAALDGDLTIEQLRVVPVNYARRQRCVLRYEIAARSSANQPVRREVYGKIANDSQGAQIAPVIAALQANSAAYQFNIPRSLGFRPDLQLTLLEAIPGTPQINQLLKARLKGSDSQDSALTLEQAIDASAQIANALHSSHITLGQRRTLDGELAALQKEIHVVERIAPELAAQFQSWLERIESYAEESDPLQARFCHGDYTHAQLIFDGQQSGLVDFDTVCQAEPALDLGQFLAYLKVAAYKAHKQSAGEPARLGEQIGERFLQTYIQTLGERDEDAERLRVRTATYTVVSLLRMALHSWQQLKPARVANVFAVLEEELACLPQLDY